MVRHPKLKIPSRWDFLRLKLSIGNLGNVQRCLDSKGWHSLHRHIISTKNFDTTKVGRLLNRWLDHHLDKDMWISCTQDKKEACKSIHIYASKLRIEMMSRNTEGQVIEACNGWLKGKERHRIRHIIRKKENKYNKQ